MLKHKLHTRWMAMSFAFVGYHGAKFFLWNRGIGAQFFYYTRFLSIPVYLGAMAYTTAYTTNKQMLAAGVFEYNVKREKWKRHTERAKRILDMGIGQQKAIKDSQEVDALKI